MADRRCVSPIHVVRVCDMEDRPGFFDKNCAKVLDHDTTEAARRLIQNQGSVMCRFEREGGVYVMEAEIEGGEDASGFPRQGRWRPRSRTRGL